MPVPVDPTTCAAPRRRAGARDSGPRAWEPGEHTRAFKCFSQHEQQQPAMVRLWSIAASIGPRCDWGGCDADVISCTHS